MPGVLGARGVGEEKWGALGWCWLVGGGSCDTLRRLGLVDGVASGWLAFAAPAAREGKRAASLADLAKIAGYRAQAGGGAAQALAGEAAGRAHGLVKLLT